MNNSLAHCTPQRHKVKRKSTLNTAEEETENALVPYDRGDALRKTLSTTMAAVETTTKRAKRSTRTSLIHDVTDPSLPWGNGSLEAFTLGLPGDTNLWQTAFDKQTKLIMKEQRKIANQEDNGFILHKMTFKIFSLLPSKYFDNDALLVAAPASVNANASQWHNLLLCILLLVSIVSDTNSPTIACRQS